MRAARYENGKYILVPADMKYPEWKNLYVDRFEPWADNGLNNNNKFIDISPERVKHALDGEFTNPRNPRISSVGNPKSGGHGNGNIQLLEQYGIDYNITKILPNGVRLGNIPSHKERNKKSGTGQTWFPENWDDELCTRAATYVANLYDPKKYLKIDIIDIETNKFIGYKKFGNFNGVTIGVIYDINNKMIGTFFPDELQRLL